MKKGYLPLLIIFLIIPLVNADISIKTDQTIYNLGNKIKVSASVLHDEDFEGFFKLAIKCENYKLEYFLTPINLEANFRTAVNVPELAVLPLMIGKCAVVGDLLTNNNLAVEEKESNGFGITNRLLVLPVNSKITSLPGDIIQIAGVVNEAYGNNALKPSIKVVLDSNSYSIDGVGGKFSLTLDISKKIKSGEHKIEINAYDQKANTGDSSIDLEITPVPSYIKIELSGDKFAPGSKSDILPSLYDQADDLINATLDLELIAPNGNKIFRKVVQSNEKINYEFSQYAEPGSYVLMSTYKNLLAQALINITTVREAKIKYENNTVLVENTGNVVFEDELTFILENELKKYPITKKVKVEPSKLLSIDLSRDAPFGVYNVLVPIKEGLNPIREGIKDKIQGLAPKQSFAYSENESILALNTTIYDNRPIYKKITSGILYISGYIVGADGLLTRNPIISPMILVIVVFLIIIRYGRRPIMRLIKRKKKDDD